MSVYVDSLMICVPRGRWRWGESCHMIADSLTELHAFAAHIGLRRAWFQDKPGFPHYDLNTARRVTAVGLGAVEIDRNQLVRWKYTGKVGEAGVNPFGDGTVRRRRAFAKDGG
jgi:hypothetical protein